MKLNLVRWLGMMAVVGVSSALVAQASFAGGTVTGKRKLASDPIPVPTAVAPAMVREVEGLETKLSDEAIEETVLWSNNREKELKELVEDVSSSIQPPTVIREKMIRVMDRIVKGSGTLRPETLMRFMLNRGLRVSELIGSESDPALPSVIDEQVWVLKRSIDLARKYYQNDIAFLNGRRTGSAGDMVTLPYARFGAESAQLLIDVSRSLFDASAQYAVSYLAFELLNYDLYRDLSRDEYAPIRSRLLNYFDSSPRPGALDSDASMVIQLQEMNRVYVRVVKDENEIFSFSRTRTGSGGGSRAPVETPRTGGGTVRSGTCAHDGSAYRDLSDDSREYIDGSGRKVVYKLKQEIEISAYSGTKDWDRRGLIMEFNDDGTFVISRNVDRVREAFDPSSVKGYTRTYTGGLTLTVGAQYSMTAAEGWITRLTPRAISWKRKSDGRSFDYSPADFK